MKRISLSLFIIFTFTFCYSQRYNFKEYNVQDGLIHSTVTTIAEDQRGYLWLGTYDGGISQFDGNTFVNYSEGQVFGGYYIWDIEPDPNDGSIWIASNKGLVNFNGSDFTAYNDSTVMLSSHTWSLLFDSNKKFWIGTPSGIQFFKNGKFQDFEYNHLLSNKRIYSLEEASDKSILIGTFEGLYKFKEGRMDSLKTFENDSIGVVYCIKEDSKKNIWFGTHYGIGKYDGKKVFKYEMEGITGQNIIQAIEEDKYGNMWFATRGGGAFVYDGDSFNNISDQNGLSSNGLFSLFKDSNDVMWVGGGGINKYYGELFQHLSTKEGLVHNSVFPIIEDHNGDMWFGSEGGISKFDTKTGEITNYTTKDGLSDHNVTSIMETKNGDIWAATQTGLNKLVNGKFIQHPKYKDMEVWNVTAGENNEVWIGTSYGLVKEKALDETLYRTYKPSSSVLGPEVPDFIQNGSSSEVFSKVNGFIDDASIYTMNKDDNGNMWFGTMYRGLFKYSNGKFEKFSKENGLLSNGILQIKSDGRGGVWIGTNKGLSHYQNGEIRTYTIEDGLWMDMIYNVVVDEDDVWIGGAKGIQRVTFDDNGDIIDEMKFGQHEGFVNVETNDVGGMKDSKGDLWFGTIGGVTKVNPDKINHEISKTKTHITSIKLFFDDVDWSTYTDTISNWYRLPNSLILPPDKNQLTFEFIGLNLKIPERIEYQWKLEGFDNNWSPISQKQEANYTNIPPGKYTFLVKATNERGVWNSVPASFSFSVDFPFYQRWWFVLLSIIFIVSSIWTFISYRLNSIRKASAAREKTLEIERKIVEAERKALRAQINPHFIFNVLNSIQYYIQDNEPLVASRYLSKFAKLMRMILDNSKHSSVPLTDEIESLKLYIDLEILRSEYKFEYEIEIDESVDVNESNIPPMLIQPFIENSIRHGLMPNDHKGLLKLRLTQKNDNLQCIIEDNGVGINSSLEKNQDVKTDHVSSGMKITGDRLEIINTLRNNDVSVEIVDLSEIEEGRTGTRVTIYIPIE